MRGQNPKEKKNKSLPSVRVWSCGMTKALVSEFGMTCQSLAIQALIAKIIILLQASQIR